MQGGPFAHDRTRSNIRRPVPELSAGRKGSRIINFARPSSRLLAQLSINFPPSRSSRALGPMAQLASEANMTLIITRPLFSMPMATM